MSLNMKLVNWCIREDPDPYKAPEARLQRIHGNIEGNPDFGPGDIGEFTLNTILSITDDDVIILHSGDHITVGQPLEDYAAAFPNCRQRLLDSIRQHKGVSHAGTSSDRSDVRGRG